MSNIICSFGIQTLKRIESLMLTWINGCRFPPGEFCLINTSSNLPNTNSNSSLSVDLKKLMQDNFLLAVPKCRRSVEKRMNRKFGFPQWVWKPLVPKTNLLICIFCNHSYEAGHLCMHCYNKVQEETKVMQDAVQAKLGLDPIDKEVVILFKGEKQEQSPEYWEDKNIVELEKERPAWFSKNLLQKTMQMPSTSKDVKPTELA